MIYLFISYPAIPSVVVALPPTPPRPPSLSISPLPPGCVTRRSKREVNMTPAPFYTLTAGDLTISAISDGQMTAPLTLLAGIAPDREYPDNREVLPKPRTRPCA